MLQVQVASCLRTGDDCMGIAAVLPLDAFRGLVFMKQILKYWTSKADATCKPQLAEAAAAATTGILVTERVINAPPEVSAPLIAGISHELKMCRKNADEPELAPYAELTHFLVCAKAYVDTGVRADASGGVQVSDRASTSLPVAAAQVRCFLFLQNATTKSTSLRISPPAIDWSFLEDLTVT